jgi:hypothetical protein
MTTKRSLEENCNAKANVKDEQTEERSERLQKKQMKYLYHGPTSEFQFDLTENEEQLFGFLLDVEKQYGCEAILRVAGGWVRDKVSKYNSGKYVDKNKLYISSFLVATVTMWILS